MTIESEVSTLTTSVNSLTAAVNVAKSTLDAKVTDATTQKTLADGYATTAESYKDAALAAKTAAETAQASANSAVAYQDLTAIADSKSVTAVDVFVYDTSKDSDGGAWRDQTQHTSWYNETLNTTTRGATKKFPAVAVIVLEANKITIYDGDDPSMPMWMVFNGAIGWNYMFTFGNAPSGATSVACLNGRLAITTTSSVINASTNGVFEIVFPADTGFKTRPVGRYKWQTNIADRNASTTASWLNNTVIGPAVISSYLNDVAMTVLPNAPIDADTGLPVPTIAVATDGGVSVIKDDGSVVHITNPGTDVDNVCFYGDSKLACANGGRVTVGDIPTSDETLLNWRKYQYSIGNFVATVTAGKNKLAPMSGHDLVIGCGNGLRLVAQDPSDYKSSMLAEISTNYNTGWLLDSTVAAVGMHTSPDNIVGGQLITNGDFTSNVTGWTAQTGFTITHSGGALVATQNGGGIHHTAVNQQITTVTGQAYAISFKLSGSETAVVRIGDSSGASASLSKTSLSAGTHIFEFVASATSQYITFGAEDANVTSITVDDVSVTSALSDRSKHQKPFHVIGEIDRAKVSATNDLSYLTDFTANNIVEQAYNSDMDVGTGDWAAMAWVRTTAGATDYIYHRRDTASSADQTNHYLRLLSTGEVQANLGVTFQTTKTVNDGTYHLVGVTRTDGLIQIWIDGKPEAQATGRHDLTAPGALLRLGISVSGSNGLNNGRLALVRFSTQAPTAAQIEKMYRDESKLFGVGAKCVLAGAVNNVLAVTHDADTNLVHAGTNGASEQTKGRSVFSGLQRVDQTTNGITVGISAVNGLVVEE